MKRLLALIPKKNFERQISLCVIAKRKHKVYMNKGLQCAKMKEMNNNARIPKWKFYKLHLKSVSLMIRNLPVSKKQLITLA